jgi:hypothetical protein
MMSACWVGPTQNLKGPDQSIRAFFVARETPVFEEVSPYEYPPHLDRLVSATEAAKTVGIPHSTISRWAAKGTITAVEVDDKGCPLFMLWDVLEAQLDSLDAA